MGDEIAQDTPAYDAPREESKTPQDEHNDFTGPGWTTALSHSSEEPVPLYHERELPMSNSPPAHTAASMAEALELYNSVKDQQTQAQQYWSSQKYLPFGQKPQTHAQRYWISQEHLPLGQTIRRESSLENMQETPIEGAPMLNEFLHIGTLTDPIPLDDDVDDSQVNGTRLQSPSWETETQGGKGGKGKKGGGKAGRGGRRSIKFALQGTEHDPAKQKAEANAAEKAKKAKPNGGKKPRGPRKQIDPGPEFTRLQSQAMVALMDGDQELALDLGRQAVMANPEIYAAHQLVSDVLMQLGREREALSALLSGANTARDPDLWIHVGNRTFELGGDESSTQELEQALFCFSQALNLADKRSNHDQAYIARSGKRDAYIGLSNYEKALVESRNMLHMRPTDWDNVRVYAELSAESRDFVADILSAKRAYDRAFELRKDEVSFTDEPADQWSHANVYLDLLDKAGMAEQGVVLLKRLARWILGRKAETFWEQYLQDDREFDCENDRRGLVGEFQQGRASRDRSQYGDGLPIELRVKLGIFRIKMGMRFHEEGMKHLDHLLRLSDQVEELYDLFITVADTLRSNRMWQAALQFYVAVANALHIADEQFTMNMAECYVSVERYGDAEDIYRGLIRNDNGHIQARVELARMYERMGWKDEALPIVKEIMALRRPDKNKAQALAAWRADWQKRQRALAPKWTKPRAASQVPASTPRDDGQNSPAPAVQALPATIKISASEPRGTLSERIRRVRDQQDEVQQQYAVVKEYWPFVQEGSDTEKIVEWMQSAARMVQIFRQMECFYQTKFGDGRHAGRRFTGYGRLAYGSSVVVDEELAKAKSAAQAIMDRLQSDGSGAGMATDVARDTIPVDFHGLLFPEWHRVFVDLALLYARFADQATCLELIKEGLFRANVFYYDQHLHSTSLATALCCGLIFNDSELVSSVGRALMERGRWKAGMPYQLLVGASGLCYANDTFATGLTIKFMHRLVQTIDHAALPADVRDAITWPIQVGNSKPDSSTGSSTPAELDPGVLTAYGHMLSSAGRTDIALWYYLRAYALLPEEASISLGIGLTYVQDGMKSSSENRQYAVQQGLAFLYRYRDLRLATGDVGCVQEAEYNMARAWHMLGLTHLAVPGYEKVMVLSEQRKFESSGLEEVREDYALEAAFALQQIYAQVGNEEAAAAVTEQWLVI